MYTSSCTIWYFKSFSLPAPTAFFWFESHAVSAPYRNTAEERCSRAPELLAFKLFNEHTHCVETSHIFILHGYMHDNLYISNW